MRNRYREGGDLVLETPFLDEALFERETNGSPVDRVEYQTTHALGSVVFARGQELPVTTGPQAPGEEVPRSDSLRESVARHERTPQVHTPVETFHRR